MLTRRAMGLHATILVVLPVFGLLCAWQVRRALSGNGLSWAYVFEWPFFAGYAVYLWWKLVNEDPEPLSTAATRRTEPASSGLAAETQPDLAPTSGQWAPEAGEERAAAAQSADGEVPPDPGDGELAAYNRYLAELNAHGAPKRW